jgi:uncharacterized protein YkwD
MRNFPISRRRFLEAGTASAFWPICKPPFGSFSQTLEQKTKFEIIRTNLLQLVNEERSVAKVPALEMDDLATAVATAHAEDMAKGKFTSHWGRDGLKPYQRYSLAGGYHATQENVSAANNTWSTKLDDLKQDTSYLHVRLYQETPPNDGHRKAILAPQHTHVGFGIAVDELRLRMVELFVSKYVELKRPSQTAKPKAKIPFSGKLLESSYVLKAIEVFYEPLPKVPDLDWLRETRSYSLPNESQILKPILPPPYFYADRQPGVIDVRPAGDFHAPITLFKESPGIYTVVCWVKRNLNEKAFPATELCIRADLNA